MIGRRTLLALAGSAAISAIAGKAAAQTTASDAPIASTRYGKVRGVTEDGVHVFKGIRYGASTAGANRFRPPKPPEPWTDVRDALAFPPMSPQPPIAVSKLFASWTFDTEVSEDCLGVNVWTPALRDGRKRPVMVWFHGGAYSSLSGSRNVYDGTQLCKKGDVVVVTLNHRLNSFGFLHLADIAPDSPMPAMPACSIWSQRCNGSATTSPSSAAIPATSRSSGNPAVAARFRP